MSPTQFQIMSDLHLEAPKTRPTYEEFKIEPQCQYLALLGDIGNVIHARLFTFLEAQLQQFEIVFYLLGNHEAYRTDFPTAQASVRAFAEKMEQQRSLPNPTMGRFVFLERTRYDLTDDITVLGCTLYSHISPSQRDPVSRFVSDFSRIQQWTVDTHCAAHEADLGWLNGQVAQITQHEPHRSIVIFTHHSPTLLAAANDPRHLDDANQVQSAFATDVSDQVCWTSAQVRLWAFGHTHFNCDFWEPRTGKRVVANQKGYHGNEAVTFSATKVVGVDGKGRVGDGGVEAEVGVEVARRGKGKRKNERCRIL